MIGYLNHVSILLVITGILALYVDMRWYRVEGMKKEEKAARYVGWSNLALGILVFAGNWLYLNWLW